MRRLIDEDFDTIDQLDDVKLKLIINEKPLPDVETKIVSNIKIMQDENGFYVGRTYSDMSKGINDEFYSRESLHFKTFDEASSEMYKGFY